MQKIAGCLPTQSLTIRAYQRTPKTNWKNKEQKFCSVLNTECPWHKACSFDQNPRNTTKDTRKTTKKTLGKPSTLRAGSSLRGSAVTQAPAKHVWRPTEVRERRSEHVVGGRWSSVFFNLVLFF